MTKLSGLSTVEVGKIISRAMLWILGKQASLKYPKRPLGYSLDITYLAKCAMTCSIATLSIKTLDTYAEYCYADCLLSSV
jgi:hypothetical protein